MKPSESLYWIRAGLGIIIGALNALYDYTAGVVARTKLGEYSMNDFLRGLSFALLFFIITYYILKLYYINKFEKKSKLITTGIGTYFLVWMVTWILFHTIIASLV